MSQGSGGNEWEFTHAVHKKFKQSITAGFSNRSEPLPRNEASTDRVWEKVIGD